MTKGRMVQQWVRQDEDVSGDEGDGYDDEGNEGAVVGQMG